MEPLFYRMNRQLASRWVATLRRDDFSIEEHDGYCGKIVDGDSSVLIKPYQSSEDAFDLSLDLFPQPYHNRAAAILISSGAIPNLPINEHGMDLLFSTGSLNQYNWTSVVSESCKRNCAIQERHTACGDTFHNVIIYKSFYHDVQLTSGPAFSLANNDACVFIGVAYSRLSRIVCGLKGEIDWFRGLFSETDIQLVFRRDQPVM